MNLEDCNASRDPFLTTAPGALKNDRTTFRKQ